MIYNRKKKYQKGFVRIKLKDLLVFFRENIRGVSKFFVCLKVVFFFVLRIGGIIVMYIFNFVENLIFLFWFFIFLNYYLFFEFFINNFFVKVFLLRKNYDLQTCCLWTVFDVVCLVFLVFYFWQFITWARVFLGLHR